MDAFLGLRHTKPPSIPSDAVYVLASHPKVVVHYNGHVLRLGRAVSRLFVAILVATAQGRRLDSHEATEVLYGDDPAGGPDRADFTMRINIRHLRERLAPIGLGVLCHGWTGYWLAPVVPHEYRKRGKGSNYHYPYEVIHAPDP